VTRRSAAAAAWIVAAGLGAAAVRAQVPVFRAGVDAVIVDVDVRENGRPVAGLGAADFELLDNGVAQIVDARSLKDVPLDVTLLVDASGSVDGRRLDRLKSGVRDTAQWLRPDDRWTVIAIEHVLREIVRTQPPQVTAAVDALRASGGTALYDGLGAALMQPTTPGRRPLIVAYTDGDDTSSILDPAALLEIARRSDALMDIVVPIENARDQGGAPQSGPMVQPTETLVNRATSAAHQTTKAEGGFPNESTLTELVTRTGGRLVVVDYKDSVSTTFKRVLDEYRTSYLLQYTRTGVAAPGWHDLVVHAKRPGHLEVRARRGYWGG
jgi:VWFA-related protein